MGLLIELLQVGFGAKSSLSHTPDETEWREAIADAGRHGVQALCFDAVEMLHSYKQSPPKDLLMQWLGQTISIETVYKRQLGVSTELAAQWHGAGLRTFVLKGFSVGMLYPYPKHRPCGDLDTYLLYDESKVGENLVSAFENGNLIAEQLGATVDRYYYVHSKFNYKNVVVENHQHLMPIKGNKRDKDFERKLLSLLCTEEPRYIGDTCMESPSPMFQALFILSHAKGHFMNEKINLRHVCDWAMVIKAYRSCVDWNEWEKICREYDLLKFAYALSHLAEMICGVKIPFTCVRNERAEIALLKDILTPECIIAGRTRLVRHFEIIRNILSSSWKFRMFSSSSSIAFVWKRVWGYLFDKDLD